MPNNQRPTTLFPMTLHRLEPSVDRLLHVVTEDCEFTSVLKVVAANPYPRAEFFNGVVVVILDDSYGVWHVAYPLTTVSFCPTAETWTGARFEDVEDPGSERWRWMEQRHPGDIIRWARAHLGLEGPHCDSDLVRQVLDAALRAVTTPEARSIAATRGLVHISEVGR